jgi:GGDEF domain-containing protein
VLWLQSLAHTDPLTGLLNRRGRGATIGSALSPQDDASLEGLLKRVDAAMYVGKQAGRNCLRRGGADLVLAGR